MSNGYLQEVQKWLFILQRATAVFEAGVPLASALELRRRFKTYGYEPEQVLVDMEVLSLVSFDGPAKELVDLTEKARSWVAEMADHGESQLLVAQKLSLGHGFLAQWIHNAAVVDLLVQFRRDDVGRFVLDEEEFTLPKEQCFQERMFLTLGVLTVEFEARRIVLHSDFDRYIEAAKTSRGRAVSQAELIRDLQRRQDVGDDGELWVLGQERARLVAEYPGEPIVVDHIGKRDVTAGYDVHAYAGRLRLGERCIEVKTTEGSEPVFFLSDNERQTAERLGNKYWVYVLVGKQSGEPPKAEHRISNPVSYFQKNHVELDPVAYRIDLTGVLGRNG